MTIRVLFLAASPDDRAKLRIGEEVRAIKGRIRNSEHRDAIQVISKWAVRPGDLPEALLQHKPHIVHFSGHGQSEGIILEGDDGQGKTVSGQALAGMFAALRDNVRVVVFNACHSSDYARAVADHVDVVIGMHGAMGDEAAVAFTAAFYMALGYGRSVQQAFDIANSELALRDLRDDDKPMLSPRQGAHADDVVLAGPDNHAASNADEKPAQADTAAELPWENAATAIHSSVPAAVKSGASTRSDPSASSAALRGIELLPSYDTNAIRTLSDKLREAYARKVNLDRAGESDDELLGEILTLKRAMREGGLLRAGDVLDKGRYVLLKQLGKGGFATVWRALDERTNTLRAVKVLHSNLAGDRIRRDRFFRGARLMAQLDCEGVVPVLEPYGEDGGYFYFVMELIPGGTLRTSVLSRPPSTEDALDVIVHISNIVAYAHQRGYVHRDIKPANVLLTEDGAPMLTDFDLVTVGDTTGGTRTGALGTFVYAAPEMMRKPQDANATADVYGLAMTGIFVLHGDELPTIMMRYPDRVIDSLKCGKAVKQVLKRAIEWEPVDRYADAQAFGQALRQAREQDSGQINLHSSVPDHARTRSDEISYALRFISGPHQGDLLSLHMNRTITIGRSSDLDVVLVEDMVSRRHAQIITTANEVYIEDMGSVNGTFINGEKVGRMRLTEGDRILVGTSIIKLIVEDPGEAEARRRLEAERRRSTVGYPMSGSIREIPLPDLLRWMYHSGKNGLLMVVSSAGIGQIYLRSGHVYFAAINGDFNRTPEKSIVRMLSWTDGTFTLETSAAIDVMEEIEKPTNVLLDEGMQRLDEFRMIEPNLPSLRSALAVPTPLSSGLHKLTRIELDIFRLVLDHGQFQAVLDHYPGSDLDAARALISLLRQELVVVV
ncbi:MAG: protein kinase [Proteobacteria bacterium]|nr:protein kinase [Pseudomonadota bacterium]